MKGYTIEDLYVGQSFSSSHTVTNGDVHVFAGVSGDFNPLHLNDEFAATTVFKSRIAHGMLSASYISGLLAAEIPGGIYLGQELRFVRPVRIGDTVTVTGTVQEILLEKNIVKVSTVCTNQNGEEVITGVATIRPQRRSS